MGLSLSLGRVSGPAGKVVEDQVGVERFNLSHDTGGAIFGDGNIVEDHLGSLDFFLKASRSVDGGVDGFLKFHDRLEEGVGGGGGDSDKLNMVVGCQTGVCTPTSFNLPQSFKLSCPDAITLPATNCSNQS